jgi:hypothetical protein
MRVRRATSASASLPALARIAWLSVSAWFIMPSDFIVRAGELAGIFVAQRLGLRAQLGGFVEA